MATPACRCGSPTELRRKTGMSAATPVYYCQDCGRIESVPARGALGLWEWRRAVPEVTT